MSNSDLSTAPCRSVTAQEIKLFHENGWVKLQGMVSSEYVGLVLSAAHKNMGRDGDSNANTYHQYFNMEFARGLEIPAFRPLLAALARNAKTLMARNGIGARLMDDVWSAKLPADGTFRHGASTRTDFHQDFPVAGVDRSGGMMFWLALVDMTPEMGTMSFLNRSHRMGPLAAHFTHHGHDLTEVYPKLAAQCPSSGPISYKAGDVTVHSNLTVHGAGENRTDHVRWAYITVWQPSDAYWTGAHVQRFEELAEKGRMKPFGPLDADAFPVLSE